MTRRIPFVFTSWLGLAFALFGLATSANAPLVQVWGPIAICLVCVPCNLMLWRQNTTRAIEETF